MCGGKGTRLKELTESIPKPLVEIGGKPVLWHIMKIYSHHGFNEFILCAGYKGEMIKEYFEKGNSEGWDVSIIDTGQESTKSERLMKVSELIKGDNFLFAYGDDVCDVNIKEVIDLHLKKGKTVTLTAIPLVSQFGIIDIKDNDVLSFREKPRLDHWFSGGFIVFNKDIFKYLDKGELEKEVFDYLAKEKKIAAYQHEGFWKSMNTLKDNVDLNELWDKGNAPWKVW